MRSLYDHGTPSKYRQGCRAGRDGGACEPCKRAHAAAMRRYCHTGEGIGRMDVSDAIDAIAEVLHGTGGCTTPRFVRGRERRDRK